MCLDGFKRERKSTCSLSSWRYLATEPYEKSSTFTKLDPAKSKTAPSSLQMPTCPMKGANHDTTGSGVQTKQHGNFAFFGSISSNGQNSCWISCVELACSASWATDNSIWGSLLNGIEVCSISHTETSICQMTPSGILFVPNAISKPSKSVTLSPTW